MEYSPTDVRIADDRLLLLMEKQILSKEGSSEWYDIQQKINQLIAERFLRFVNR
jgi:hypothetical protein